jgi:hemoglobin/transferrin/lactoferrin receptor protein
MEERPLIRALFFVTGLLSLNTSAVAEADTETDLEADAERSLALDDVVVSATRTERPRFTTPAATSTLRRDRIQRIQPYGYQDLFESIPGVNVLGGPRRIAEEPSIRGFADEQVIIRLDGARQNFNKAHGGRFFVDPDLLRSVEVLRGAGSAIYGSGALGGAFILETLSGRDLTGGADGIGLRQKFGWQSNGEEWASYTTGYAQSGAFDVLGNYIARDVGEDFETGAGDDILATRDEIANGMAKFGWQPGAHQRLELTVDRFDNSGDNPTNANAVATPRNLVDRDTERTGARLRYRLDDPANRWVDLDATVYRNDVETIEFRLDDQRVDATDFRTRGLELVNTSRLAGSEDRPLRLTWGIEAYGDEQQGTRDGGDRRQFPDAEVDYRAAFVQAELPLGAGVSLIPGLRFDAFEYDSDTGFTERDDEELTPRVALGWEPVEDLYVWGEYAEAFRAPSLTELYADGVHFVVPLGPGQVVVNEFVATPDLEPEHAEQFQLGARWRTDGLFGGDVALEVDAVAYRSDVEDFVDQFVVFIAGPPQFDPLTQQLVFPGITTNRNVDAELEGAEVELRLAGSRGFLQASLTTVDGEAADGGDLASVQADRAVVGAGVYLLDRSLTLGAQLVAAADRRDVPEGALATPGYGKTDVFAEYLPLTGPLAGFEFRLAVDNVFDKDYRIHPNGIDAPGRSVRVSIARDFEWLQ